MNVQSTGRWASVQHRHNALCLFSPTTPELALIGDPVKIFPPKGWHPRYNFSIIKFVLMPIAVAWFIFIGIRLFNRRCNGYEKDKSVIIKGKISRIYVSRYNYIDIVDNLDTVSVSFPGEELFRTARVGDSIDKPTVGAYCTLIHEKVRKIVRFVGPNPRCDDR